MVLAARARGLDTGPVLDEAGLAMATLETPEARIPVALALSVWEALRERTRAPTLQLEAPLALPYGAYRVLEYLVSSSHSVGDGVRRFARYFGLIHARVVLGVESDPREAFLVASLADGAAVPPVYVDYIFAALVCRVRMRPRPDLRVARVELRRDEPEEAPAYERVFRAPVAFGASRDRLCFAREEWDSPMATRDPTLAEILDEHARWRSGAVPDADGGAARRVQDAIVQRLPDGARVEDVARSLGLSVRTLQRSLAEAGTSFSALLEEARRGLAEAYLSDPRTSVGEVALLLGFGDQSSFHRAFLRWTGEAPGRWRRARLAAGAGRGPAPDA